MKRITSFALPALLLLLISSCAGMPDATIKYYLPKTSVDFKVIRTVTCNAVNRPFVANAVTPLVHHSASKNNETDFFEVNLKELEGTFSDTDVKFDFYDDGRLKGINASNTGQGEAILKTVGTITAAALTFAAADVVDPAAYKKMLKQQFKKYEEECDFIRTENDGEPLTLTYDGSVSISKNKLGESHKVKIELTRESSIYHDALPLILGDVYGVVESITDADKLDLPFNYKKKDDDVVIKARQPGVMTTKVISDGFIQPKNGVLWSGKLPVAQFGRPYFLPIPKPALFGKTGFAASFTESGTLTSVQYAKSTGAGQVLNVLDSSVGLFHNKSVSEKAAQLKAEGDLIAMQQRLVKCQADPTSCK